MYLRFYIPAEDCWIQRKFILKHRFNRHFQKKSFTLYAFSDYRICDLVAAIATCHICLSLVGINIDQAIRVLVDISSCQGLLMGNFQQAIACMNICRTYMFRQKKRCRLLNFCLDKYNNDYYNNYDRTILYDGAKCVLKGELCLMLESNRSA